LVLRLRTARRRVLLVALGLRHVLLGLVDVGRCGATTGVATTVELALRLRERERRGLLELPRRLHVGGGLRDVRLGGLLLARGGLEILQRLRIRDVLRGGARLRGLLGGVRVLLVQIGGRGLARRVALVGSGASLVGSSRLLEALRRGVVG